MNPYFWFKYVFPIRVFVLTHRFQKYFLSATYSLFVIITNEQFKKNTSYLSVLECWEGREVVKSRKWSVNGSCFLHLCNARRISCVELSRFVHGNTVRSVIAFCFIPPNLFFFLFPFGYPFPINTWSHLFILSVLTLSFSRRPYWSLIRSTLNVFYFSVSFEPENNNVGVV